MPAEESRLTRLGVIAGGGDLPRQLLNACDRKGIETFVVILEGQADPSDFMGSASMTARMGAAGQIIDQLKKRDIRDLVLIGRIKRPGLSELRPDMKTLGFFARIGSKALGDDGLLKAIRHALEAEGFTIHGVQDFIDDLTMPSGALGIYQPQDDDLPTIEYGIKAATALGALDIGQAVIVQQGIVLAVEGVEGTAALIGRSRALQKPGRGAILVKACKPQQDRALDLPTIGPDTVRAAADAGFAGIAAQAGATLVVNVGETVRLADQASLFLYGFEP